MKPRQWRINDAVCLSSENRKHFSFGRVIAVDENGRPVIRTYERHVWLDTEEEEARATYIGVYRRLFGFLWFVFYPNSPEASFE